MLGKKAYTSEHYVETTTVNDSTGEVTQKGTHSTHVNYKSDKQMLGEWLGVGRYFIIISLILFFIAPVYNELNEKYTWIVTENGNTYSYVNPKDNVEDYKNLGNKMLSGFTETLELIGNVSEFASKEYNFGAFIGDGLDVFNDIYSGLAKTWENIKSWFTGLFN